MRACVEKAEVVEVEAEAEAEAEVIEVAKVVHRTMNHHSALLEVAIHDCHPLLHGLYLLCPLLLIPFGVLIQLHIPPVGLFKLPLH